MGGQGTGAGVTTTGRRDVKDLTLDTGALLALKCGDSWARAFLRRTLKTGLPLSIPAGVVAQAWRGGPRQVRVARLLADLSVHVAPLDDTTMQVVGLLCGCSDHRDIANVHVALLA